MPRGCPAGHGIPMIKRKGQRYRCPTAIAPYKQLKACDERKVTHRPGRSYVCWARRHMCGKAGPAPAGRRRPACLRRLSKHAGAANGHEVSNRHVTHSRPCKRKLAVTNNHVTHLDIKSPREESRHLAALEPAPNTAKAQARSQRRGAPQGRQSQTQLGQDSL